MSKWVRSRRGAQTAGAAASSFGVTMKEVSVQGTYPRRRVRSTDIARALGDLIEKQDTRRRHIFTLRLTDEEMKETRRIAKKVGKPMADVWHTYHEFLKVFYSELTLGDALVINRHTMPIHKLLRGRGDPMLHKCMRPFAELIEILRGARCRCNAQEGAHSRAKKKPVQSKVL